MHYDEGYSIRDIDNEWLNSNMDYETDYDFDSGMDDYNYNYNNSTNNWSTLTEDKTNRQTDRHNNSFFLDIINKKLESLEIEERSIMDTRVENKSDSFLDLLEKLKVVNSEREFKPLHRSPLTKTMTDNWHNEMNNVIENWHINSSRKDDRELKATNRPITIAYKDNKIDFDERKDYSHKN